MMINITPVSTIQYNKRYNPSMKASVKPIVNQAAEWFPEEFFGCEFMTPHEQYIHEVKQMIYDKILKGIMPEEIWQGFAALRKLGNFTISEYKKLTQEELDRIRKLANAYIDLKHNIYNIDIYNHDIVASGIRDELNRRFGEGNYVVISIGQSLSSICKCLGYKIGENDVKQLPMSSAYRFLNMEKCKKEDFDKFRQYLALIGLSKEEVKASEKQYIFMDYCFSRRSLKGVENLFKSKIYGNLDNVQFIDIAEILKTIKPEQPKYEFWPGIKTYADEILEKLRVGAFKRYSVVKGSHLLGNTKNAVIKPDDFKLEPRIFMFELLDKYLI